MRTRPRPARWRGFAGVGLLLAGLLLAAYLNLGPGPTARAGASTLVFLPRGSGVSEVSQVLTSSGVIRSERLFQVLARATGAGRSLKAGDNDGIKGRKEDDEDGRRCSSCKKEHEDRVNCRHV